MYIPPGTRYVSKQERDCGIINAGQLNLTAEYRVHGPSRQKAQVHRPASGLSNGASVAGDATRGFHHLAEAYFFSQTAVLRHLVGWVGFEFGQGGGGGGRPRF